jgi:cobalamin biosynthesis Mg chelatase CobN
MNEAIIENYLCVIQGEDEPENLSEGMREFMGKFNKQVLKRTMDKLHMAFSNGDGQAFDDVAKKTAKVAKIPKAKEIEEYMGTLKEDNPEFADSVELSKKVLKNTFKLRDKNKLEIIANMTGMAAWVKSKGGKYDLKKTTRTTLQSIGSQVSSVYDTGFDDMESNTPEEEELQRKMIEQSKKQEKIEMIIVAVVLSVLAAAVVWAGISIWSVATSPWVLGLAAISAFGVILFKILCALIGVAAVTVIPTLMFLKGKGA